MLKQAANSMMEKGNGMNLKLPTAEQCCEKFPFLKPFINETQWSHACIFD